MKIAKVLAFAVTPLCIPCTLLADDSIADITMTVIEEGESVDRVLEPIPLPEPPQQELSSEARQVVGDDSNDAALDAIKDDAARHDLDALPAEVRDNLPEDFKQPERDPTYPGDRPYNEQYPDDSGPNGDPTYGEGG